MGTKDRAELMNEWNEETNSWNEVINEDFSRNQLLKDILKVLTKDLETIKWISIAKVFIERNILNKRLLHDDKGNIKYNRSFGRAMRHIGIEGYAHTISQKIIATYSNGKEKEENMKFTKHVEKLLNFLLSMQGNKEYSPFDNDNKILTDTPETFSFMSTHPNIAFVENGIITLPSARERKDGTCIILSKNEYDEGKYYRVRVEGNQIYDDSRQPGKDRLMGRIMGYCLTLDKQLFPEYNDEKQKAENMGAIMNRLLTCECALSREKKAIIGLAEDVEGLAESGNGLDAGANNHDFQLGVCEGKQIADEKLDPLLLRDPFPCVCGPLKQ